MFKRVMKAAKYGILLSLFVASVFAQTGRAGSDIVLSEVSGMYSFEREGEFVQLNVEQPSAKQTKPGPLALTGFISRFADADSDRGAFLDYFITKGSLDGSKVTFVTKTIHGLSYEFAGTIAHGTVDRSKDGYYEIRGTLTQNTVAEGKVTSAKTREITLKLYPELSEPSPRKK